MTHRLYTGDDSGLALVGDLPFELATPDAMAVSNQGLIAVGASEPPADGGEMIRVSGDGSSWQTPAGAKNHGLSNQVTSIRWLKPCAINYGTPTGGIPIETDTGEVISIPGGQPGQILIEDENGVPTWATLNLDLLDDVDTTTTPPQDGDGLVYDANLGLWVPTQVAAANVDWADIQNKPATFPPDPHGHDWTEITGKPTTFPPEAHTHSEYVEEQNGRVYTDLPSNILSGTPGTSARLHVDSLHTAGLGSGQIFIEGAYIDANTIINIGKGQAGGQSAQKVQLANGASINEFSTDGTLAGNSDDAVPTEKAVKTYVDGKAGGVTDHGALTGLADDDHTQYYNQARGDARYTLRTSAARPGVTKLYRRDNDSAYNVQTHWDGVRWVLQGYLNDTFHANCRVEFADNANNATNATNASYAGNASIQFITAQYLSTNTNLVFYNIPQTYESLLLVYNARSMRNFSNDQLSFRFAPANGVIDASASYACVWGNFRIDGTQSSGGNWAYTEGFGGIVEAQTADWPAWTGNMVIFPNYRSGYWKSWAAMPGFSAGNYGQTNAYVQSTRGVWKNTGPITHMQIFSYTTPFTFVAGSRFYLYGIKDTIPLAL